MPAAPRAARGGMPCPASKRVPIMARRSREDAPPLRQARDEEREAEKEREMDHEIDQRARDAVDMFPKFSTTNVAPTPRHLQLQES